MSTATAEAVVNVDVMVPGPRRASSRLVQVPAQAGPAPKREAGHPLALGRQARVRLRAAVQALLDAVEGQPDPVRWATVVLASRTPEASGVVVIRTRELGRWLGLSKSRTASAIVRGLRASGVAAIETEPGEFGQDEALNCVLTPLVHGRGVLGHPLALSQKDFALLWGLVNAIAAPGWAHRNGTVTAPGLLGERTGRGSSTDRLALLLLVLEATSTGRVRLCGGAVDKHRGRAVATLARLMGCGDAGAERTLERLEQGGLALRPRLATASGLNQRGRLILPAVAAAHRGGSTAAVVDVVREVRQEAAGPDFSEPDVAATGSDAPCPGEEGQVSGTEPRAEAESAEPDDTAALHTDHPSVVCAGVLPRLSGGFSGEGRGGEGRRPERACAREDQAADGEAAAAGPVSPMAEAGPLRGEKPADFLVEGRNRQRAAGAKAGRRPKAVGGGKTQLRKVGPPADLDLQVALEPVGWLWEQLSGWQQDQVEAAAKAEVKRLAGMLMRPETAPHLLADRLTDRLAETGGEALIASPFGWLTRRGLVQRQACSDGRCDDGIRLDTGGECENCGNVVHYRRARRARIAAEVDEQLPGLGDGERRQVLEERLREQAAIEAEDFVWRRELAAAEQARRDAARAAGQERAARERAAAAAADAIRQALPCEDCGQERSAGLCEACGYRRRTEEAIVEAGLVAATWCADLDDPGDIAAVAAHTRASLEAGIETARRAFLELVEPGELDADPARAASALAFAALQVVQQAAPDYRRNALVMLARTPQAEAEARRAYATEQNRRWFRANPNGADAVAAATKAAGAARERTAQYLLTERLGKLREQAAARTEQAGSAPWTDRLPGPSTATWLGR